MKLRNHKCGVCQGEPRQHNIRDARIVVNNGDGRKEYPQHGFKFTGGE